MNTTNTLENSRLVWRLNATLISVVVVLILVIYARKLIARYVLRVSIDRTIYNKRTLWVIVGANHSCIPHSPFWGHTSLRSRFLVRRVQFRWRRRKSSIKRFELTQTVQSVLKFLLINIPWGLRAGKRAGTKRLQRKTQNAIVHYSAMKICYFLKC